VYVDDHKCKNQFNIPFILFILFLVGSVEANTLEQQQAPAIIGSKLAYLNIFLKGSVQTVKKIFRTASSKIEGTGQTEMRKHVHMSKQHNSIFTNSHSIHNLVID